MVVQVYRLSEHMSEIYLSHSSLHIVMIVDRLIGHTQLQRECQWSGDSGFVWSKMIRKYLYGLPVQRNSGMMHLPHDVSGHASDAYQMLVSYPSHWREIWCLRKTRTYISALYTSVFSC